MPNGNGAIRRVSPSEDLTTTIDAEPADLHDARVAACKACGVIGRWRYLGFADPYLVEVNGGFGLVRRQDGTGPPTDGLGEPTLRHRGPVFPAV